MVYKRPFNGRPLVHYSYPMKTIYISLVSLFFLISCQQSPKEGVAVINLAALTTVPLDHPIDELAKGDTFIDVDLPDGARIDRLSQQDLGLLKAAAYRFYKHVALKDNRYAVDIKDGKGIKVADDVVSAYIKALMETNVFADSLQSEGQEIRLPAISDEYLLNLLK